MIFVYFLGHQKLGPNNDLLHKTGKLFSTNKHRNCLK